MRQLQLFRHQLFNYVPPNCETRSMRRAHFLLSESEALRHSKGEKTVCASALDATLVFPVAFWLLFFDDPGRYLSDTSPQASR